jgi:hypothetical protein
MSPSEVFMMCEYDSDDILMLNFFQKIFSLKFTKKKSLQRNVNKLSAFTECGKMANEKPAETVSMWTA